MVDWVGRLIAVAAFLMSAFTFCLQFLAHESFSYSVSFVGAVASPDNAYFSMVLVMYNEGNRSAALTSTQAVLFDTNISSNRQTVTVADCDPTGKLNFTLLFAASDTKASPVVAAMHKDAAVIEPGKVVTQNLVFTLYPETEPISAKVNHKTGIVCVDIVFADDKGQLHPFSTPIAAIDYYFREKNFRSITPVVGRDLSPVKVIERRRIELPF